MTTAMPVSLRSQSGQSSVEFAGTIVWLLLAALFAWQLALVGWTWTSAANAARTAARLSSRGVPDGDVESSAAHGLAGRGLDGATIEPPSSRNGGKWTVHVPIPIVLPGLESSTFEIPEQAIMPTTG